MKPADLQFLETQKFDTTQIARLLGIPASIMLAAVDGSNLTYSNIEQSWIEFADYTLAAYTGELEELLSGLLPRGRVVRFDWDSSRPRRHGRPLQRLQDRHRFRLAHRGRRARTRGLAAVDARTGGPDSTDWRQCK